MDKDTLNVAVVGVGYWGKNLVRNFAAAKRCNLKYVCDLDEELLAIEKKKFPFIETSTKLEKILGDNEVEAVVIATDVPTHFGIAEKSLEAGKHTYVPRLLFQRLSRLNRCLWKSRKSQYLLKNSVRRQSVPLEEHAEGLREKPWDWSALLYVYSASQFRCCSSK